MADIDEAELDAKWGLAPAEPLVGYGAPPVVAVVVTADPGDWFESTLESLGDQEYESLSILVLDNGGRVDPTERIAEVLPTAFVKRLDADLGFSAAANEVLTSVEGAAFYLFLHDDVRLEPDAVTQLVAEAFRTNGGIVGPKLVDWDDPRRLRSVGYSVDPYGFSASIAEPGELDQAQHDSPREVFAVSDACLLVRADLFDTIGGFSEDLPYFGEDIDLCWRAHVAAATVHLCPAAVVAHRGRFEDRRMAENRSRLELRHEARTMLANYEPFRLLRVVPVVALLSAFDLLGSLVLGRVARAGDIVASWAWNLANLPSLLRARSRVKRSRGARDHDYLPLMRQGSSRLRTLFRGDEGENRLQHAAVAGRGYVKELTTGSERYGLGLAVVATLLVLLGARDLFTGPIPVMREFVDAGPSASALLAEWWSGWREAGLGEAAVAPGLVPGMGLLGTLLFGSIGLARRLVVLAPLFVGALGAWKLLVHQGSIRARAAALTAYGLNPVALNAVAEGRLGALYVYAAMPWVLRRVATAAGAVPFDGSGPDRPPLLRTIAGVALGLVVVGSITPLGAALVVVSTVVFGLVLALVGDRASGVGVARLSVLGALAAVPALSPWLLVSVLEGDAASLTGLWVGRGGSPSATEVLTGSTGPVAVGVFGWGLLVAAGYALVAGRSWRLRWAVGGWVVAALSWGAAVVLADGGRLAGAGVELVLMPAVFGMAVSVAMGALAFEHDVIGADFGLPQVLSAVAVFGLVALLVPVGVASVDGRWYQPEGGFTRVLDLVDEGDDARTVWIGDPDVLPLAGWPLDSVDGLSVAISVGVDPTVTQRFRLDGDESIQALRASIDAALTGQTARLGRLLAPMGVDHLVVVDRAAPQPFAPLESPVPDGAVAALREQLDLSEVELNPGMVVFELDGAWPLRSDVSGLDLPEPGEDERAELLARTVPAPPAVLGSSTGTRFDGTLPAEALVARSGTAHPGWSLTVDGAAAEAAPALAGLEQYQVAEGGAATLRWSAPPALRVLQLIQVLSLVALATLVMRRRRLVAPAGRGRRRSSAAEPLLVVGDVAGSDGEDQPGATDDTTDRADDHPGTADQQAARPDDADDRPADPEDQPADPEYRPDDADDSEDEGAQR